MECDKIWNSLDWFNPSTLSCLDNATSSSWPMRWLSSWFIDQSEPRISHPPSWESTLEDITDITDMTRCWHEIMESRGDTELTRCFHIPDTSPAVSWANLGNMGELSRTKVWEHVENDSSIMISLWSFGVSYNTLASSLSWPMAPIAAYSPPVSSFLYK